MKTFAPKQKIFLQKVTRDIVFSLFLLVILLFVFPQHEIYATTGRTAVQIYTNIDGKTVPMPGAVVLLMSPMSNELWGTPYNNRGGVGVKHAYGVTNDEGYAKFTAFDYDFTTVDKCTKFVSQGQFGLDIYGGSIMGTNIGGVPNKIADKLGFPGEGKCTKGTCGDLANWKPDGTEYWPEKIVYNCDDPFGYMNALQCISAYYLQHPSHNQTNVSSGGELYRYLPYFPPGYKEAFLENSDSATLRSLASNFDSMDVKGGGTFRAIPDEDGNVSFNYDQNDIVMTGVSNYFNYPNNEVVYLGKSSLNSQRSESVYLSTVGNVGAYNVKFEWVPGVDPCKEADPIVASFAAEYTSGNKVSLSWQIQETSPAPSSCSFVCPTGVPCPASFNCTPRSGTRTVTVSDKGEYSFEFIIKNQCENVTKTGYVTILEPWLMTLYGDTYAAGGYGGLKLRNTSYEDFLGEYNSGDSAYFSSYLIAQSSNLSSNFPDKHSFRRYLLWGYEDDNRVLFSSRELVSHFENLIRGNQSGGCSGIYIDYDASDADLQGGCGSHGKPYEIYFRKGSILTLPNAWNQSPEKNRGCIIISDSDINIPANFDNVDAFFLTEGIFKTLSAGANSDKQLIINGGVIASQVDFNRDLVDNELNAAEIIMHDPKYIDRFRSCIGEPDDFKIREDEYGLLE